MDTEEKSSLGDDDPFNDTEADEWDDELTRAAADGRPPGETPPRGGQRRDWRDAEKYREARELRRQIDDLYWFDGIEKADRRGRTPR